MMGAAGLLGWGVGGLAVAALVCWLTLPPPWVAVIAGGLGVLAGWSVGAVVIGRIESRDDPPG